MPFNKLSKEDKNERLRRRKAARVQRTSEATDEIRHACHIYLSRIAVRGNPTAWLNLASQIRYFLSSCSPTISVRRNFVSDLIEYAIQDKIISESVEEGLAQIADALLISEVRYLNMRRRAQSRLLFGNSGESDFTSSTARRKKISPIPNCYAVLGCVPDDSDCVIRKTYRRLANKLHPDKHASKFDSPDAAQPYVKSFQQLHAAYEEVCRLRNIRR